MDYVFVECSLTLRVPANNKLKLLSGTIPANSNLLSGTLPANSNLLSGTLPANSNLLSGTLPAKWEKGF